MNELIERTRIELDEIRETLDTDVIDVDIDNVQNKCLKLTQLIGSSAACKARAKKILENAKLIALSSIQDEKIGSNVMLNKMNSMCSGEHELYEYADRINSAIVHSIDALRSVISLYKTELENNMKEPSNTYRR